MAALTIIWWRDIPAQVVAKDARRAAQGRPPPALPGRDRQGRDPGRHARVQTRTSRSGARRPRRAATTSRPRSPPRSTRLEARRTPGRADPDRRRRRRPAAAGHDIGGRAGMTDDRSVGSATPRGRDRLRPPVRDHRRADQPDRPEAAGRGDEGRRLQPGRARRRWPRSRPAPTCSTSTPASRSPTSRRSWPGRSSSSSRSPTCRCRSTRRSSRRSRPGSPSTRARPLVNSVTGEDERLERVLPLVAEVRRRGRRDLERRDRHLRGPRRPLRGREADRRAGRRPRHPARGHRRRSAGDADRGDGHGRPAGLPARPPAARRAQGQHAPAAPRT